MKPLRHIRITRHNSISANRKIPLRVQKPHQPGAERCWESFAVWDGVPSGAENLPQRIIFDQLYMTRASYKFEQQDLSFV